MALGAFALVASEFMPVSLLTPIAADLHVSEGIAGQAISVSGAFALLTSLCISSLAGKIDRKTLLMSLTLLMIISGSVAAFAPGYAVFIIARALIGIAIGGFWSMSAATAIRLVSIHHIPRALAIVNGGNALASVIAAPLGSYLGEIVGWRWAFFSVVPIAALALCWKWVSLPPMQTVDKARSKNVFVLLKNHTVATGMAAVALFFLGQFTLFTYLRPYLETVTGVSPSVLSLMLLIMGIAGFAGTTLIGAFLKNSLHRTLIIIPILMALIAAALIIAGQDRLITTLLLGAWGLIATAAPVAWWTWLAKALPQDSEAGGGLMVAVIQLAIGSGSTLGGFLFDTYGFRATFGASATALAIAAILAAVAAMQGNRAQHR